MDSAFCVTKSISVPDHAVRMGNSDAGPRAKAERSFSPHENSP